jgi:hypothetical protein
MHTLTTWRCYDAIIPWKAATNCNRSWILTFIHPADWSTKERSVANGALMLDVVAPHAFPGRLHLPRYNLVWVSKEGSLVEGTKGQLEYTVHTPLLSEQGSLSTPCAECSLCSIVKLLESPTACRGRQLFCFGSSCRLGVVPRVLCCPARCRQVQFHLDLGGGRL